MNDTAQVLEYTGPERRRAPHISDEQLEEIAERAADRAVKKLTDDAYKTIGKSVLDKLFWIVGVLAAAAYFWVQAKGLPGGKP